MNILKLQLKETYMLLLHFLTSTYSLTMSQIEKENETFLIVTKRTTMHILELQLKEMALHLFLTSFEIVIGER